MLKKIVYLGILVLIPSGANAYCSRGFAYDYDAKINSEFKYLLCLHNEQVESLNNHADLINNHANGINRNSDSISQTRNNLGNLESSLASVIDIINEIVDENRRLRSQIFELEYRISTLE